MSFEKNFHKLNIVLCIDYLIKNYMDNEKLIVCDTNCGKKDAYCTHNYFLCKNGFFEKLRYQNKEIFKFYLLLNLYYLNNKNANIGFFTGVILTIPSINKIKLFSGKRNAYGYKILLLISFINSIRRI